ncbi:MULTISPECIES: VanW family protein [unclassified Fusibacter]|uniref:VanW family protein n=1 Tax=unclassified Fusibacter TaxID=2624464 RepID=UPI001010DEEF|nr:MULTISPECIES: VanW family protein [unclassified Fusibacter]MCK8058403.1 VanW family protein [Fusibacter sp. A2]NPE23874.1 VanW family protein [Fusibacter sp. A1]RXV58525.1 hypothetical protein DWB64_18985 [Fusibacter sp. A1]
MLCKLTETNNFDGDTFILEKIIAVDQVIEIPEGSIRILSSKKGYLKGLMIKSGNTAEEIGGGLCQCTNLINWMVLHTPLQITEHHHHNGVDMFPDFNRQIPFGTGTSIMHNYLDYQFYNPTNNAFQLSLWTCEKYLRGELRCDTPVPRSYHVKEDVSFFIK